MDPKEQQLLLPSLEHAFWRSRELLRYRDQDGFSKKKGHFEPEELNAYAGKWAEELTRESSAAEIRQIYENAVVILGNRRSTMERSERDLDCPQFRYQVQATQNSEDPSQILVNRILWIKGELAGLPEHFDDLFPYRSAELVVPVTGVGDRREILIVLEEWEHTLKGKLEESADQNVYRLVLQSGLTLTVDLANRETSFSKIGTEGVGLLASSLNQDLKGLKIPKQLL